MLIKSVEAVTKDRSRVVLDSGEDFVLYKGEIRLLQIKEGVELPQSVYSQIMGTILPRRAKLRMMNLLKQRDYTSYQLRSKLMDAGYPESVVDIAYEYVKSYGYVDDRRYASEFTREQMEHRSRKEIFQKLVQKGIDRNLIEDVHKELYGENPDDTYASTFDEKSLVLKTLKKKGFTGKETYEEKQKILAYFYRRGFNMDDVYHAMDSLSQEC